MMHVTPNDDKHKLSGPQQLPSTSRPKFMLVQVFIYLDGFLGIACASVFHLQFEN